MSMLVKIIKYALFVVGFYMAFAFAMLPIFLSRKATEFFDRMQQVIGGENFRDR